MISSTDDISCFFALHSVRWLEGLLMGIQQVLECCLGNIDSEGKERRERFRRANEKLNRLLALSDANWRELRRFLDEQADTAVRRLSEYLQSEQVLAELAFWKPIEYPSSTVKTWEQQLYLICHQLEGKVRVRLRITCFERSRNFTCSLVFWVFSC